MTLIRHRGRVTGLRVRKNPASRKLYNAMAADLKIVYKYLDTPDMRRGFVTAVDTVADNLKRDNSRFDKERFVNAVFGNDATNMRKNPRKNPPLVTFGNPPVMLSDDVVEIRYKHKEDGQYYKHAFSRKQVQLMTDGAGSKVAFLRRVDGKPLIGDY